LQQPLHFNVALKKNTKNKRKNERKKRPSMLRFPFVYILTLRDRCKAGIFIHDIQWIPPAIKRILLILWSIGNDRDKIETASS
jgi:hypothetical protein